MFCGIFDGHGPWGHFVAKKVREWMPSCLLCNWQETLGETSVDPDIDLESDKKHQRFNIWKHSYIKTCAAVDQELGQHRKIDTCHSGTTALTIVRQVTEVAKNSCRSLNVQSYKFYFFNLLLFQFAPDNQLFLYTT